jgi:polar amino acid transport system substrate-binding protein
LQLQPSERILLNCDHGKKKLLTLAALISRRWACCVGRVVALSRFVCERRASAGFAPAGIAKGGTTMRTLLVAAFTLLAMPLAAMAQVAAPPDALKDLAPTGKLRAAINFGNAVLAQKDEAGGPKGITPDLAAELGRRLGVPVEFVPFEAAGKAFDAAKAGAVDIAFIAIEPARAAELEFSAPYVMIEGTYMVPVDSPLKEITDVDRPGVRIAVGLGSAYDLYLTRTIRNANIVRASTGGGRAMIELFLKDRLEVAAGVRQQLEVYAKDHPEMRIMAGRFQEIQQAMGAPKGRLAGAAYLRAFVEDVKANGFVAGAVRRAGQSATVAPPAK